MVCCFKSKKDFFAKLSFSLLELDKLSSVFNEGGDSLLDGITYVSNQPELIKDSYYVHSFTFQITGNILQIDIVDESDVFAFRRIQETYVDEDKEETGLENDVILD